MKRENIALQLYSVRGDLEKDFFGTIRSVKEIGYSGVEFAGLYGHDPLEVKAFCEEIGITPLSAHVPFQDFLADMDGTVATYKALGVKYVAIPYLTEDLRPGQPGFRTVIEGMKVIGAKLKEAGIVQQYHNHDFEFVKLDGEYALDILYKEIGPELLQTQLDTCWVNVGGEEPAGFVRKYSGRAPVVHLKDFYKEGHTANMYELIGTEVKKEEQREPGFFEFRPVGYGMQNFPAILEAAVEAGAQWVVVEQDRSNDCPPIEAVKKSREYLKGLGW